MKHKLVMPDDDPRSARVVWSEQKGDVTELCIAVDHEAWQPIDTAPKDGTKIMVACPWLGVCGPANWDEDKYAKKPRPYWTHWGERIWGTLRVRGDQPTHWQPMPEAPNAALTGAEGVRVEGTVMQQTEE